MRIHLGLTTALLLFISSTSCADPSATDTLNIEKSKVTYHHYDKNLGHTYILTDASVFVAQQDKDGAVRSATLFYNGAVEKDALVNKMLWVLEATNASTEFRDWAKKNLARNRRFEKDSFVMPLKSVSLETHEFTFANTGHNQLYILAYRRLRPGA
jgi:hypothetical protein